MINQRGTLIVISGIDGSGKSTVQKWIKEIYERQSDHEVLCIDGMKPLEYTKKLKNIAQMLHQDMFELFGDISLLAYSISLIRNYVTIIQPALEEGKIVISHRGTMCCKAYTMLRDKYNTVMPIVEQILKPYEKADLSFYCNVDVDTALERIAERIERGYQPSINENRTCLTEIAKNYSKLLQENKDKVIVLDTASDIKDKLNAVISEHIAKEREKYETGCSR